MVFHDALDFNNLVDGNNKTVVGRTGVDYCLYSPFSYNITSKGETDANPNHNRGLNPAMWFVNVNTFKLSPWFESPDVEVLGAVVALEDWF